MHRGHLGWVICLILKLLFFNSLQSQEFDNSLLPDTLNVPWFEIYNTDEEIRDLTIGPSGDLWIATNRGVVRFHETEVQQRFDRTHGLPHEETSKILSAQQSIVVATKNGIVFIRDTPYPDNARIDKDILFKGYNCASIFVERKAEPQQLWVVLLKTNEEPSIGHVFLNSIRRRHPIEVFSVNDLEVRELLPAGPDTLMLRGSTHDWFHYDLKTGKTQELRLPELAPLSGYSHRDTTWILGRNWIWRHTNVSDTTVLISPDTQLGRIVQGFDHVYAWRALGETLYIIDLQKLIVRQVINLPNRCMPIGIAIDFRNRLWIITNRRIYMSDLLGTKLLNFPDLTVLSNPISKMPRNSFIPKITLSSSPARRINPTSSGFASNGDIWMIQDTLLALSKPGLDSASIYTSKTPIQDVNIQKSIYISDQQHLFRWQDTSWNQLKHIPISRLNERRLTELEKTDKLFEFIKRFPELLSRLQKKYNQDELYGLERQDNLLSVIKQEFTDSVIFSLPDSSAPISLLRVLSDSVLLFRDKISKPLRNRFNPFDFDNEKGLIVLDNGVYTYQDNQNNSYTNNLTLILGNSTICYQPSLFSTMENFYATTSNSQTGKQFVLTQDGIIFMVNRDLSSH